MVLGAILVFFAFPRRDEEERLLAEYQAQDTRETSVGTASSTTLEPEPAS